MAGSSSEQYARNYVLGTGYQGTARLNLQHFFWKDQMGYNLHPSIPTSSSELKIADIGTGTGIWLLEMARTLASSAQLDGFDNNLSQCPPKEWLPDNVNIYDFDAFADLPEHLIGKYDILHIRLFLLIVQNNDPMPLLKTFIQMLKPGGYIQWAEYDLASRYIVHAQSSNSSANLTAAIDAPTGLNDTRMHPKWVADLPRTFREGGLIDVFEHRKGTDLTHLLLHNDVILLALEEMSYRALDRLGDGKGQALRESLIKADLECRKGVAINQDRVTVIGRRPL